MSDSRPDGITAEAWQRALQRIATLEARVSDTEARLRALGAPPVAPPPKASPPAAATNPAPVDRSPDFLAQALGESMPSSVPSPARAPETDGSRISRVLGAIATLAFVAAGALLVKISFDSGWLTPMRQMGLAAVVGSLLIVSGIALSRRVGAYAAFLPAAGTAVFYAAAMLGFFVHGLYSPWVCLGLMNAVSVVTVCLPKLLGPIGKIAIPYGVLAALGAYGGTFALAGTPPDPALLSGIFVAWALVFSALSVFVDGRTVAIVSSYLGIGLYHWWMHVHHRGPEALRLEAVVQLVQFLAFATGVAVHGKWRGRVLTAPQAWVYLPSLLFFYAIEFDVVQAIDPRIAPPVGLLTAIVVLGVYLGARYRQGVPLASGPMAGTYASLVALHAVYVEWFLERERQWAGPALLLILVMTAKRFDLFRRHLGTGLVLGGAIAWSLASAVFEFAPLPASHALVIHGLTIVVAYVAASGTVGSARWLSLFLAHAQWIAFSSRLLEDLSARGLFPAEIARYALSVLWACYAAVVLAVAKPLRDRKLALSSLLVLAFAVVKLFVFDVDGSVPLVRVLCFFAMGILLYVCGWVLRNVNRW